MDLNTRMKDYEDSYRFYLPKRMPVIIRLDGRAFHTLTKYCNRYYDGTFAEVMISTAKYVANEVQNCSLAYIQSDEISLLLNNWKTLDTESWFGNNLQKMCSISAALASSCFSIYYKMAQFDSRVFVLPELEVCNYFIQRQRDAENNSIQMLGQSMFNRLQLFGKNKEQIKEMLESAGIRWEDCPTKQKRGTCVVNGEIDYEIPIFSQQRDYIERHLADDSI